MGIASAESFQSFRYEGRGIRGQDPIKIDTLENLSNLKM